MLFTCVTTFARPTTESHSQPLYKYVQSYAVLVIKQNEGKGKKKVFLEWEKIGRIHKNTSSKIGI